MDIEALIRTYLAETHTMQLATIRGDQPWVCSVYFAADEELNLFWVSTPGRRHSQEIALHPKVAIAIAVQQAMGERVVGVQAEGEAARLMHGPDLRHAAEVYHAKFAHDPTFVEDFAADRRQHKFYRFTPRLFVLFDEQTFSEHARKEWRP